MPAFKNLFKRRAVAKNDVQAASPKQPATPTCDPKNSASDACSPSSRFSMTEVEAFGGKCVFFGNAGDSEKDGNVDVVKGVIYPIQTSNTRYNYAEGHKFCAGRYHVAKNKVYIGCTEHLSAARVDPARRDQLHADHAQFQFPSPLQTTLQIKKDRESFSGSKGCCGFPDEAMAQMFDEELSWQFEEEHTNPPLYEFIQDDYGFFGPKYYGNEPCRAETDAGDVLVVVGNKSLKQFAGTNKFRLTKAVLAEKLAVPTEKTGLPSITVARGVTCGKLVWKKEFRKPMQDKFQTPKKPYTTRFPFFNRELDL